MFRASCKGLRLSVGMRLDHTLLVRCAAQMSASHIDAKLQAMAKHGIVCAMHFASARCLSSDTPFACCQVCKSIVSTARHVLEWSHRFDLPKISKKLQG